MRKIKFRGKAVWSLDKLNELNINHVNGWIYGNLVMYDDIPFIVALSLVADVYDYWVKVHPESVGQYTGLKDKNGHEIYEGDIVECFNSGNSYVSFKGGVYGLISDYSFIPFSDIHGKMKVIGNIYENPELLEGENETD